MVPHQWHKLLVHIHKLHFDPLVTRWTTLRTEICTCLEAGTARSRFGMAWVASAQRPSARLTMARKSVQSCSRAMERYSFIRSSLLNTVWTYQIGRAVCVKSVKSANNHSIWARTGQRTHVSRLWPPTLIFHRTFWPCLLQGPDDFLAFYSRRLSSTAVNISIGGFFHCTRPNLQKHFWRKFVHHKWHHSA